MKIIYDQNADIDVLRLSEVNVCFAELDLSEIQTKLLESNCRECIRSGIRQWIMDKMRERCGDVVVADEESDMKFLGSIEDGIEIMEGYYCSFDINQLKLRLFVKSYNVEWAPKN